MLNHIFRYFKNMRKLRHRRVETTRNIKLILIHIYCAYYPKKLAKVIWRTIQWIFTYISQGSAYDNLRVLLESIISIFIWQVKETKTNRVVINYFPWVRLLISAIVIFRLESVFQKPWFQPNDHKAQIIQKNLDEHISKNEN